MKLELTEEQVDYLNGLTDSVEKKEFIMNCIIENLDADLNKNEKQDDFVYSFSMAFLSRKPEINFEEEVLDYEILTLQNTKSPLIISYEKGGDCYTPMVLQNVYKSKNEFIRCFLLPGNPWKIHSVKRKSDGEVFTIGDEIDFGDFGPKGFQNIERFEIDCFDKTRMTAYNGAYGIGLSRWNKRQPIPLFTTEDGVDVYTNDKVFSVSSSFIMNKNVVGYTVFGDCKIFSTKEEAEQYILMNKPCLSLNDLVQIRRKTGCFGEKSIEEAEKLAKSKL